MKRKKISIIALACLLLVGVVGGAYAYWNQTATVTNPFDTGKFNSEIIENFNPADGQLWQPGTEVNKDVLVTNSGDQALVVRVKMDEAWTRKGDTTPYKSNTALSGDVYTAAQTSATDGLTASDRSVVTKTFAGSANWVKGADGWYYYRAILQGGQSTDKWLDSVALLGDADMGTYATRYYISITDGTDPALYQWVEYTGDMPAYYNPITKMFSDTAAAGFSKVLHNKAETAASGTNAGYSDSDYTLTITAQTVQATKAAVMSSFGLSESQLNSYGWTLK